MSLFSSPERELKRRLDMFKANFLHLISDGHYPPHRQNRLFVWCQKAELDWDLARQYVAREADNFLRSQVQLRANGGALTPEAIAELRNLQRRLTLSDAQALAMRDAYALVERQLLHDIGTHAAYLSAAPAIEDLHRRIAAYPLPAHISERLRHLVNQQHALAKLTSGQLPAVTPSVSLYKNEICHFDAATSFFAPQQPARDSGDGRLLITSERILLLVSTGGYAAPWSRVRFRYEPPNQLLLILAGIELVTHWPDAQYVSTLISAAARRYQGNVVPEPARPAKRL